MHHRNPNKNTGKLTRGHPKYLSVNLSICWVAPPVSNVMRRQGEPTHEKILWCLFPSTINMLGSPWPWWPSMETVDIDEGGRKIHIWVLQGTFSPVPLHHRAKTRKSYMIICNRERYDHRIPASSATTPAMLSSQSPCQDAFLPSFVPCKIYMFCRNEDFFGNTCSRRSHRQCHSRLARRHHFPVRITCIHFYPQSIAAYLHIDN